MCNVPLITFLQTKLIMLREKVMPGCKAIGTTLCHLEKHFL